jgi:hypothetical protein
VSQQAEMRVGHTPDGFLSDDRVRQVYETCFRSEHVRFGTTQIEAWLLRHTFNVKKLMQYREDIVRMLCCLPRGFRSDERGGGSVYDASHRDDGTMWTGDMADVEKLIALGIAVQLVEFCAPRANWHRLPSGLPYIRVLITRFGVRTN